ILWELRLEGAGLFTDLPWPQLVQALERFEELMRERGYRHGELFYSLFFLGFDSLPDVRLTRRGVWDVRAQKVLYPPERLGTAAPSARPGAAKGRRSAGPSVSSRGVRGAAAERRHRVKAAQQAGVGDDGDRAERHGRAGQHGA